MTIALALSNMTMCPHNDKSFHDESLKNNWSLLCDVTMYKPYGHVLTEHLWQPDPQRSPVESLEQNEVIHELYSIVDLKHLLPRRQQLLLEIASSHLLSKFMIFLFLYHPDMALFLFFNTKIHKSHSLCSG